VFASPDLVEAANAAGQQLALALSSVGASGAALLPAKAPAAVDAAAAAASASTRYSGWLSVVADPLENFLLSLTDKLRAAGVPYPQGASIVALTATVKFVTFPFVKRQIESGMAMQNLQPQIKALRERWEGPDNAAKLSAELDALYKRYNVSPLAGCIPTLLTLPVLWGTYRALSNGSVDGAFAEPFFWLPSLAGPGNEAFPGNTGGLSWLWPLDAQGAPPIGWPAAQRYLVLPVSLVLSQYASTALLPTPQPEGKEAEDAARTGKVLAAVLPLMVGSFSLSVPAGLGLYWLANNIFTTAITYYLKEGGGAEVTVPKLERPKLKLGTAIRSGVVVEEEEAGDAAAASVQPLAAVQEAPEHAAAAVAGDAAAEEEAAPLTPLAKPTLRRSKRLADPELRKTEANPRGLTRLPPRKAV